MKNFLATLFLLASLTSLSLKAQDIQGCDNPETIINSITQNGISLLNVNGIYYTPMLDAIRISVSLTPAYCGSSSVLGVSFNGDTIQGAKNTFNAREGYYRIWGNSFGYGGFNIGFHLRLESALSIYTDQIENKHPPFPNPFSDFLEIPLNPSSKESRVEILNSQGQSIYNSSFYTSSNVLINLSNQETGIYFVRIVDDQGSTTTKVLKQD